jgi:hypothetical protein
MGKSPLSKNNNQARNYKSYPAPVAAQKQIKPTTQKASLAHQTAIPSTPRANLRLARGADTAPQNSPPRSRAWRPFGVSLPRSRALAPRASLRFARGLPPPATPRLLPPTRALNALTHRGRPGQRRIPATSISWHSLGIWSRPVQTTRHYVALYYPLPPFLYAAPLEMGRLRPRKAYGHQLGAYPGRRCDVRLAGHTPSVTSGPVRPSWALRHHPQCCESMCWRDVATLAAVQPKIPHQPDPRAGVRTTTRQEHQHDRPRSRPWTSSGATTTRTWTKIC